MKCGKKTVAIVLGLAVVLLGAGSLFPSIAKVRISFYSWMAAEMTSGGVGVLQDAKNKFERLNPGVDIDIVPLPYEETQDQITLMMAAGSPPDITTIDVVWLAPLVFMGGLEPLDSFMTPDLKESMIPAAYNDGLSKGKLYALTWNPNPNYVVYNKDLLKKAGIAKPATNMKEFDEQMAAISELAPVIYGSAIQSSMDTLSADYFHPWLWAFGGEIVDEEGNIIVNQKGAVDAVTWFKKIMDNEWSPKGQYIREIRILFSLGRVGYMLEGPWIAGILRGLGMKDEEWDVAPIPGSPAVGEIGYTQPAHHMLVMSKQSKNKDLAWKFMEFIISDPEITRVYFERTGLTPALKHLYTDEVYAVPLVQVAFEQMKAMKKPNVWNSPRYAEAERFFMVALQKTMLLGVDPQKALNELAENLKVLFGAF